VDAGDFLLACFCIENVDTWGAAPAGWTALGINGFEDPGEAWYYKFADGSEDGGTVTATNSANRKGTAQVFRITGVRTTHPGIIAITGMFAASGRVGAFLPFGASDMLWISYISISSTSSILTGAAAPSGYSALNVSGTAANDNAQLATATKAATGAVDEVQGAWDTNGFSTRYGLIGLFGTNAPDWPSSVNDYVDPQIRKETFGDFSGADTTAHSTAFTARKNSLLVAIACFDNSSTTITTPSGWSQKWHYAGQETVQGVYTRRADGLETAVDFVTNNNQAGVVYIFEFEGAMGLVGMTGSCGSDYTRPPLMSWYRPALATVFNLLARFTRAGAFTTVATEIKQARPGGAVANSGSFQWFGFWSPLEAGSTGINWPNINYELPNSQGQDMVTMAVVPEWFNATISGTVLLEGSPVEDARVYATDGSRTFGPVLTNSSGEYSLPVIDGYEYHVMFEYEDAPDLYNALSSWAIEPIPD